MAIHKGTELNNVNETWNQNERLRENDQPGTSNTTDTAGTGSELEQTITEEAREYDNANKDERVLDGERATVNDNPDNIETMK
ncbi:MAG TPA: hypothetical protein VER36_01970 [Flavisolibacter sp.]|nr:hypothetical protein [Flavisolibacter sp.]